MPDIMSSTKAFLDKRLRSENLRHNIGLRRFTGVTMLNRQSYELALGLENLRDLDMTEHSALHAVLLLRKDEEQKYSYNKLASMMPPIAAMVATPVPPESWGNALRICFTLESKPGQFYALINALRKKHLYVRHVDTGDGLGLDDFQVVSSGLHLHPLERAAGTRNDVRPTTVLTVEVPRREDVEKTCMKNVAEESRENDASDEVDLELLGAIHDYLDAWKSTSSVQNYKTTLERKIDLVTMMHEAIEDSVNARIEWVSPLQMLASLKDAIEASDTNVRHASQHLPVCASSHHEQGLAVSLGGWKKFLDPTARDSIERSLSPGLANLAAVITTDREERTLTAEFLSLKHYAVMQFEIIFPTGRMGHRWKEWILELVKDAGGGVLRMFSMGRLEGRWGREVVIAWFPFSKAAKRACDKAMGIPFDVAKEQSRISSQGKSDDDEDDPVPDTDAIRQMIECVRNLKGLVREENLDDSSLCEASLQLKKDIDAERKFVARELLDEEDVDAAIEKEFRKDSTLHDVKIWYRWPKHTSLEHRGTFQKNPFNFTRPLTYSDYGELYQPGSLDKNMSRLRLANRICQRLRDPQDGSVILVGAHRSGKTSIMNMVLDILSTEKPEGVSDGADMLGFPEPNEKIIGIRINAAVTPPHQFLLAIVRELKQVQRERAGKLRKLGQTAAEKIRSAIRAAQLFAKIEEWSVRFSVPYLTEIEAQGGGAAPPIANLSASQLLELLAQREREGLWDTPEGQAAFLRLSVECLREAMGTLEGEGYKLVVAMDEISESAAWGNALAFPVWRHLIESQNFKDVRWLFSSTRPPTDATGYSPLSNALREYTMRPLNESEAHQLINNFDRSAKIRKAEENKKQAGDEENNQSNKKNEIPLVVTYGARELITWATGRFPYLLQVTCVYVFDQAIGYHIPIITSALVRKILEQNVTPALTEYFQAQWAGLPDDCKTSLRNATGSIEHPLGRQGYELPTYEITLTPQTARCVQLAGLGWQVSGSNPIAPLFANWLKKSAPCD